MSLSFVSKSVLTANSDGTGFEETAIEGGETGGSSSTSGGYSAPLFEQLRKNKDQEDEERDEYQKSIMRGTLALDEEDCAHLDAVRKQRQERDNLIHRETQSELEAFRAAQQLKQIEDGMKDDDDDEEEQESSNTPNGNAVQPQNPVVPTRKFPTIIAKKKRKVVAAGTVAKTSNTSNGEAKKAKKEIPTKAAETKSTPAAGLGSLLAGYGSDSDSD